MKTTRPTPSTDPAAPWRWVAAAATALFLVILGLMLSQAERLVGLGLAGQMWFLLLLVLGLLAAVVLFAVFKSQAIYKGQVLNGTLQLGGPGVLMLVIVVLGYALPPKPGSLDLTVFLRLEGDSGQEVFQGARLQLDLGADRREEAVESKGLVRFMGIPAALQGRSVPVSLLQAPLLVLAAGPSATLALAQEAVYLDVRWKPWPLQGQVQDENGTALAAATVAMAGHTTVTDAAGRFTLALGSQLAPGQRVLEVRLPGYVPWRNSVATATPSVQVQLQKSP